MQTKSFLKIWLLSQSGVWRAVIGRSSSLKRRNSQGHRTATKFSAMTLFAFIIKSVIFQLKLLSAKFFHVIISNNELITLSTRWHI